MLSPTIEKQNEKTTIRPALAPKRAPWYFLAARIVAWQIAAVLVVELCLSLAGLGEEEIFKLDPLLGFKHMANKKVTWRSEGLATSYFDADGMREPGLTVAKPFGTYRVALLGDSLAESLQVPIEQSFGFKMQEVLTSHLHRSVQVLDFGVSGYSTVQEYLQLKQQVLKYKPDLVLLCYNSRDCFENWSPPDEVLTNVRPAALHLPGRKLVVDNSPVTQWMKTPRARFLKQMDFFRHNSRLFGLFSAAELDWSLHSESYRRVLFFLTKPGKAIRQTSAELTAYIKDSTGKLFRNGKAIGGSPKALSASEHPVIVGSTSALASVSASPATAAPASIAVHDGTTVSKPSGIVDNPSASVSKAAEIVDSPSASVSKTARIVDNPSASVSKATGSAGSLPAPMSKASRIVDNPSAPVSKAARIVDSPSASVSKPSRIVDNPSASVSKTARIVDSPSASVSKTARIVDNPSASVSKTARIVDNPSASVSKATGSAGSLPAPMPKSVLASEHVGSGPNSTASSSDETMSAGRLTYKQLIVRTLGSLFAEMNSVCNTSGAKFAVVALPVRSALSVRKGMETSFCDFDFNDEVKMLQGVCKEKQIDLINVHEKAKSLSAKDKDYLFYLVHLTPKGHDFVSGKLAPVVQNYIEGTPRK